MRFKTWWEANRPKSPQLFHEELAVSVARLRATPFVGRSYPGTAEEGLRRLLMPRTRYHLYYSVNKDDELIRVHAVWHASRGSGPDL